MVTMEESKLQEGKLREAACFGDLQYLQELIYKGVNVNSRNNVNGWTALHWAAYRNNYAAVSILLQTGADKSILNNKGESPCSLSTSSEIQTLLGGEALIKNEPVLPIIPNYLKNPPLSVSSIKYDSEAGCDPNGDLVLKLRVAEEDPDFIEVELPKSKLTLNCLLKVCVEELNLKIGEIVKIRKLPNTILRKDKDVQRLVDFQELEVVLKSEEDHGKKS